MKNLLLGAKVLFLATVAMAFVACDNDDEGETPNYGLTVYKSGAVNYYDEDADVSFDAATATLQMNAITFDSAMPVTLNLTISGLVDSDSDGDYEASTPTVVVTMNPSLVDVSSYATITDVEVDVKGSMIDVEFDCNYSGTLYEVEYYGEN